LGANRTRQGRQGGKRCLAADSIAKAKRQRPSPRADPDFFYRRARVRGRWETPPHLICATAPARGASRVAAAGLGRHEEDNGFGLAGRGRPCLPDLQ
jgi:hypothetical protein